MSLASAPIQLRVAWIAAITAAACCAADQPPTRAADPTPSAVRPALRPAVSRSGNVDEFPPVEARHVRFVILETKGGTPCLDELEVFTAEPDPRNVALHDAGAVASASSSEIVPPILIFESQRGTARPACRCSTMA